MQAGTDEQISKQNNHSGCREYKKNPDPFIHVCEEPGRLVVAAGPAVSLLATVPGLRSLPTSTAAARWSGHRTADGQIT